MEWIEFHVSSVQQPGVYFFKNRPHKTAHKEIWASTSLNNPQLGHYVDGYIQAKAESYLKVGFRL